MYNKYISQLSQIIGLRYEYVQISTNEDMKCSRLNVLKLLMTQASRSKVMPHNFRG
jgi:hypothetical protein